MKINGTESCGTIKTDLGNLAVYPIYHDEVNDNGNWNAVAVSADGKFYALTLYTLDSWNETPEEDRDYAWDRQFDLNESAHDLTEISEDDIAELYDVEA